MSTLTKIKIDDAVDLRQKLDGIYDTAPQTTLAKWSIHLAKHIMDIAGFAMQKTKLFSTVFASMRLGRMDKRECTM